MAGKLQEFARLRRDTARGLARHFHVDLPGEVDRFLAAAEAGRWEEADQLFTSLRERQRGENHSEVIARFMPLMLETSGVAEAARKWPAQALLDYGRAILGSLRPDMVYLGGTDSGRFIPTLLNETSEGEPHVVLTQNALADSSYRDYVGYLYGDRLAMVGGAESERAFSDYISDAQKRWQHDQQLPDEPKQVRPGEEILVTDGRVRVGGQVAVMDINDRLLRLLMERNPEASFALEESFPLKSTYAEAVPLGPVMELRSRQAENALTAERASQSIDYWRETTQQVLGAADAGPSAESREAWSKLIVSQGGLLLDHQFPAQAEEAYRLAQQLAPANPEVVFRYVALLTDQKRFAEATPILEAALQQSPDNAQFTALLAQVKQLKP